ncbi:MAG TPA: tetratricopeptide repeat protein [Allosphingosinicella sp.]|jgi:tetratricopeptide (TPR) repeat protein
MTELTCFIVMPIGKPGTDDHAHFSAISDHIRGILEPLGYTVTRADDVQASGAITKDIVTRLGTADLVIADLTDLNANVFYELGVRHALRGNGTIMTLDESRTTPIPFDLSSYRVLKYSGNLSGVKTLSVGLKSFVNEQQASSQESRDNPVHDWFPTLPVNVIEDAGQSRDAALRNTIKKLQDKVKRFEKAFGPEAQVTKEGDSPLDLVLGALSDAEDGLLPATLMQSIRDAYEGRDIVLLLNKIRLLIERNIRLMPNQFLEITSWLALLNLPRVRQAVFEQAIQLYPTERNLKRMYLGVLAHSADTTDRQKARTDIPKFITVDLEGTGQQDLDAEDIEDDITLIGLLLDALHEDGMTEEAVRISKRMMSLFPNDSRVVRNHARALSIAGDKKQGLELYRRAAILPDSSDTSAVWFGKQLHNRRQNREALEAYSLACRRDPNDAINFAHALGELAICLDIEATEPNRQEPTGLTANDIILLACCAASCPNFDEEAADRMRRAFELLDLSTEDVNNSKSRIDRKAEADRIYNVLKTDLTTLAASKTT